MDGIDLNGELSQDFENGGKISELFEGTKTVKAKIFIRQCIVLLGYKTWDQ